MSSPMHPIPQEELMAYLDGELAAARAGEVSAHIAQCAECQSLAAELRSVSQRLATWQVEPAAERVSEGVAKSLREWKPRASERPGALKMWLWHWRWAWAMAGVMVALLFVVSLSIPSLYFRKPASVAQLSTYKSHGEERNQFRALSKSDAGDENYPATFPQSSISGAALPTVPMIARTAELTLVTQDLERARELLEQVVREHQGYLANLTVSAQTGTARTLKAQVRVPADRLDRALAELKKLGRVLRESQGGEEVTQEYVDLSARLTNARHTEQRLLEVLRQRTGKVSEVLEVEREIARVRGEIERMVAEKKVLETRVAFATLEMQVNEEYRASADLGTITTGAQLRNALVNGYRGLVDSAVGLVLVVLEYGPMLLFWALILFFPVRFVWRRVRARSS